jgi:hypothetical protein
MLSENSTKSPRFSKENLALTIGISLLYLVLSYFLVGFKTDQLVLVGIFNSLYYLSPSTRKFILGFSIFIVYWVIFDYMKAIPNYEFNTVHIGDLYELEKKLFGISTPTGTLTPNEFWLQNHANFLDVTTGVFYLMWIPVPLAFAAYLFFTHKKYFLYFSLTFVWVNLLGFVIYYIYPAAPPWYIQTNGLNFIAETPGNTAGLARFDAFFNVEIFKSIYAKSSNVFAAMPSLHSAYPVIVLYYGVKAKLGKVNIFFAVVMLGIWFAAVYTSHHYIADVLAGIITAIIGIITFEKMRHWTFLTNFISKFERKIS